MIFRAVPGSARGAEDADLIARVRKGDVEGFNLLVSRWEKRVFNYLLRLTGNPDDSMDLSQDVFLKAYQNIRKLDDTARFGPWLFRIAHNEAYSGFRKKRPEVAAPEFESQGSEPKDSFFDRQIAPGIAIDLSLAVSGALDRLSPEQREAVVLKIYQGFKFDEMAEILECPVSTIKSRLYTALELLKTELAPGISTGQYKRYPMSSKETSACEQSHLVPDYAFDELAPAERRGMELHLSQCAACAGELDQLRLTTAALRVLPDQEVPRRIAFVSDPPTAAPGWLSGFWNSAARLGFASACVLAAGLSFAATHRQPVVVAPIATVSDAAIQQVVDKAVALAVDKAHTEDIQMTKTALDAVDRKYALKQRDFMVAMQETMAREGKRSDLSRIYAMSYDTPRMGAGQ